MGAGTLPPVIKALAHPLRWQLAEHLARGDHRVGELVTLTGEPQNLVSYHLRLLRDAALVGERRSSRDAREIYYSLDLERVLFGLNSSARSIHPALSVVAAPDPTPPTARRQPLRVLLLCTENSARSQLAEAILRGLSRGEAEVFSAGTDPTGVHPMAIEVLGELGFDHSNLRSKAIGEFAGRSFDYVISLCDNVREECPAFPGEPERIHWSFPDPVSRNESEAALKAAFTRTAAELTTRIRFLLLTTGRDPQSAR